MSTRTTIALDDLALETVRQYAEDRSISMGRAASDLIMEGARRPFPTRIVNGIRVFSSPSKEPKLTAEKMKQILEEEDLERARKCL
jgi:hypothetical protein